MNCPLSITEQLNGKNIIICQYDKSVNCSFKNYHECPYYQLERDLKTESKDLAVLLGALE